MLYEIEEEAKLALSIQKITGPLNKYNSPSRINGNQTSLRSHPHISKVLPGSFDNLLNKKSRAKVSVRARHATTEEIDKGSFRRERSRAKSNVTLPMAGDNYYFNKDVMYKCNNF